MKSATDPRHKKRRLAIKELFAYSYTDQKVGELTKQVLAKVKELDKIITDSAPAWPIDKLNKIDLAILRLATYELHVEKVPPKVVVDEAVELAKEFGADSSASFINGVLGTVLEKNDRN